MATTSKTTETILIIWASNADGTHEVTLEADGREVRTLAGLTGAQAQRFIGRLARDLEAAGKPAEVVIIPRMDDPWQTSVA